eukprot:COSAG02_NODE_57_length_43668_cov_118.217196_8_plen_418_part_00
MGSHPRDPAAAAERAKDRTREHRPCALRLLALAALAPAHAAVLASQPLQPPSLSAQRAVDPRVNVLMLAVDDLRPELSLWGFPTISTPNIDELALGALVFTQAHVQQAVCSPSRTSLLTGRRPDHTRVYDLTHHFRDIGHRALVTLPEYFKLRGYTSTGMGKIFHPVVDRLTGKIDDLCSPTMHNCSWTMMPSKGGQPYFHGELERYYQNGGLDPPLLGADPESEGRRCPPSAGGPCRAADQPRILECGEAGTCGCPSHAAVSPTVEHACPMPGDQLAQHASATLLRLSQRDNPFFLAVGFHKPHLPFIVPQRFLDLYPLEKIQPASNPQAPWGMPDVAWSPYGEIRAQYYDIHNLDLSGMYNSTRNGAVGDDMPNVTAVALRQHYYAAVSYTDDNIGTVMRALKASSAQAHTVVAL